MSRAEMQETLASIRTQLLEHQQGVQIKRMRGVLAGITVPLFVLGLVGRLVHRPPALQARSRRW